jgi:hypothetical protein
MFKDLPDIFIDNVLSFLNDKNVINIALCCTNIYTNFKYIIDNRKKIKEIAIKNGQRYKKIISFYEKTMKNDSPISFIIFNFLNDEQFQKEMDEWYSALQLHDIIHSNTYYKNIFKYLEILDKPGMIIDDKYKFYKLSLHNYASGKATNKQYKTFLPYNILIPPRTDILIL